MAKTVTIKFVGVDHHHHKADNEKPCLVFSSDDDLATQIAPGTTVTVTVPDDASNSQELVDQV